MNKTKLLLLNLSTRGKVWFLNLSRIGKLSVLSALALGTIAVGATNPPAETVPQPVTPPKPIVTTETKEESRPIQFVALQREDGAVAKGTTFVETAGVNGVETLTHTITLTDGVETDRKTATKMTTAPVNQVTVVGTYVAPPPPPAASPSCDPNYSGCVPVVSYNLDCADIGFAVTVLGYDKHGFDGNDNDGYGCESY